MSRSFLIPVILLLSVVQSFATGNYNAQWQKGTAFYEQKQYDSAASYFEQVAALKPQNAEVYYNLGNTYYRLNKIPLSILNYERALRINPDYKEAKDNLMLAQGRISTHIPYAGDIFFVNWWHSVTQPNKATMWAILALALFALIIAFMLMRRLQKNSRLPVQLPGIFTFICVCLLILAFYSAKNSEQHTGAVVMQSDTPLMNNEQKGKPLALIPEGTTVKIKSVKGYWVEVTLPDGRTGWVQQTAIDSI